MEWLTKAQELQAKCQALLDKAKADGDRKFTQEELTLFTGYQGEINGYLAQDKAEKDAAASKSLLENPVNEPDPADPDPNESKFENFGEMLHAVHMHGVRGDMDPRLQNAASGMNEKIPEDGGFLVGTETEMDLLKRSYDASRLAARINKRVIGAGKNSLTSFAVNETSRADGSRSGGVRMYWETEAAEKNATKPKLKKLELKLNKLIGLVYVTDELLEDVTALQGEVAEMYQDEMSFKLDDAIYNGPGAGMPLGIMNSPALISIAKEGGQLADTINFENILNMWARMWIGSMNNAVWYVNQDTIPQLATMALVIGAGGVPVYLPPTGAAGSPYATLMGKPVIPIEQAATLGDTGDIMLADMSQYKGIDRGGMQSASSIHVRFIYDETAFRFVYRFDGQPKWSSALTPFKGGATKTVSPFVKLAERA